MIPATQLKKKHSFFPKFAHFFVAQHIIETNEISAVPYFSTKSAIKFENVYQVKVPNLYCLKCILLFLFLLFDFIPLKCTVATVRFQQNVVFLYSSVKIPSTLEQFFFHIYNCLTLFPAGGGGACCLPSRFYLLLLEQLTETTET